MLAAGGTGGHLFPAFALAQELGRRGIAVDLVTDMRADRYDAGFPARAVYRVRSASPTGKSLAGLGRAAWSLSRGIGASLTLLRRVKPAAVVGFGGYPAFPPLVAARLMGVPTALHEQNAVLGRANRSLAGFVTAVATSFEHTKFLGGRALGKARVIASALARLPRYENEHGYRAGHRYDASLVADRRLGGRWRVQGGLDLAHEKAERWSGVIEEEGNLGRTDLLVSAALVRQIGAAGALSLQVKVPLVSRAHGSQVDYPAIVGLAWSR